jgi:hypothetical protein
VADTAPLTDRIVIAWGQLQTARARNDLTREITWESMLNRLIDRYSRGDR